MNQNVQHNHVVSFWVRFGMFGVSMEVSIEEMLNKHAKTTSNNRYNKIP